MEATLAIDLHKVAQDLRLKIHQIETVVGLLDAQNTVPFITRYRKDQTGGLDEDRIREIESRVTQLRLLAERKQTILRSIESQGKLTPELAAQIEAAHTSKTLEDLYLPFKPKKQTLATAAREKGLEPLAQEIVAADPACADLDARSRDFISEDRQVATAADALLGAGHIIAEGVSERASLRGKLRMIYEKSGKLTCAQLETDPEKSKEFRDYFQFSEAIAKAPPHRILAINRGDRAKAIKVKIEADFPAMTQLVEEEVCAADHPHADFLRGCARDALERLIIPSLEREVRRDLTEKAENHAVQVFARNLRNLLLQPPVRGRRVLAIDPGFRTGCKLAALDEHGNLLEHSLAMLVGKAEKIAEARAKIAEIVQNHQLSVIAIGNGSACRETEEIIADMIAHEWKDADIAYVIVNEAGASVYSTSNIGREEFPDLDATVRGTISIGRRLQDPLSELVKISPQHIGVGLYQHDVKQKHLQKSLDDVVQSCVNYVGVDVNTASVALLQYVSGLNQLTARRVVEHRQQHGPFKSREQIKDVPGVGEVTFTQSIGFLKISDGDNPLDFTWIHPENYPIASWLLEQAGGSPATLKDKVAIQQIASQFQSLDYATLAAELQIGEFTLRDIMANLSRPGRDPREDLPKPIFKKGILRAEDLVEGMELTGAVLNVVDFGAFVDIGLKDSGLVHISQMAGKFVKSPHEVVSVGDVVKVWVLSIDKERRRVSLSMVNPEEKARAEAAREEERRRAKELADRRKAEAIQREQQQREREERRRQAEERAAAERAKAEKQASKAPLPKHKPKPRPVGPPLTDAMKQGKEPMRTFGDLMQFFQAVEPPKATAPAAQKKSSAKAEHQVHSASSAALPPTSSGVTAAETSSTEIFPVHQPAMDNAVVETPEASGAAGIISGGQTDSEPTKAELTAATTTPAQPTEAAPASSLDEATTPPTNTPPATAESPSSIATAPALQSDESPPIIASLTATESSTLSESSTLAEPPTVTESRTAAESYVTTENLAVSDEQPTNGEASSQRVDSPNGETATPAESTATESSSR